MNLVLLVLIGLGTAFFVLWPLLHSPHSPGARPGEEDESRVLLDHRKTIIYENIEDLEFDWEMGKLADDDYQRLRGDLSLDAVKVLRELDRLSAEDRLEQIIDLELERLRRGETDGRSRS